MSKVCWALALAYDPKELTLALAPLAALLALATASL
jgi:hypothetical protein